MRKAKIAEDTALHPQHLQKLIEEATVDCYDEVKQASGFLTMIEENLALPFTARVLGVEASVVAVEMDDDGSLGAVCERGGEQLRSVRPICGYPRRRRPVSNGSRPTGVGHAGNGTARTRHRTC